MASKDVFENQSLPHLLYNHSKNMKPMYNGCRNRNSGLNLFRKLKVLLKLDQLDYYANYLWKIKNLMENEQPS